MDKLAIKGGQPCISGSFPTKLLGVALYGEEEMRELADVIGRKAPFRHYGLSYPDKVKRFEEMVSKRFETPYALAVSSGSAALFCAAASIGLEPGDEVILPTLTWYSDFGCIVNAGATPVFAGIDETLNLDPADFEARITPKTKAVIVVHYQGGAASMDEILYIAKARGIVVIEDFSQAFGGEYKGKRLGTLGDIGVASFQMNKMITAGEGGLMITTHQAFYERAVRYHDLGVVRSVFEERFADAELCDEDRSFSGNQYRMSELAGAVLCAQFEKLDGILKKCSRYHSYIKNALSGSKRFSFRPTERGECGITVFIRFNSCEDARHFTEAVIAEGVPVGPSSACVNMLTFKQIVNKRVMFPKMPPFAPGSPGQNVVYEDVDLMEATDEMINRHLAIGIGPLYDDKNIEDIITAIKKVDSLL